MVKKVIFLLFGLLLVPIISASCSDINLQIKNVNTEENYITIQRLIGENEVAEEKIEGIKVYIGNELKLTDNIGVLPLESRMLAIPASLSKNQEIRVDIILGGDEICEYKDALTISDENIYNYPPCDYTKKSKGSWCDGNKIFTQKCVNGQFEDGIFVDCEVLAEVCENGECVKPQEKSFTDKSEVKNQSEEEIITQSEENFLSENNLEPADNSGDDENFSVNPVAIVLNWILNLFRA